MTDVGCMNSDCIHHYSLSDCELDVIHITWNGICNDEKKRGEK